jgi:hypothetical protein
VETEKLGREPTDVRCGLLLAPTRMNAQFASRGAFSEKSILGMTRPIGLRMLSDVALFLMKTDDSVVRSTALRREE